MKNFLLLCLLAVAGSLCMTQVSPAQQRDYFTPEEVELIREAQQIDNRIEILIAMMDRRFAVLNLNVGGGSRKIKKGEVWGEPPTGSRLLLLYDIKRIMQKAIDDIDNLAERPTSMVVDVEEKKPKGYNEIFPKAVRTLADAAKRYQPVLKGELDKNNDMSEKGTIMDSLEMCEETIAAVSKLKPEPPTKPKK